MKLFLPVVLPHAASHHLETLVMISLIVYSVYTFVPCVGSRRLFVLNRKGILDATVAFNNIPYAYK